MSNIHLLLYIQLMFCILMTMFFVTHRFKELSYIVLWNIVFYFISLLIISVYK
jgi:hypothetical protein